MKNLRQRYRYSAVLLKELVKTDFKLRYQGSILGYAWSLLRPLLLFVILYLVFVRMLKFGNTIPHYPVYLLLGIVIWNFFQEMTSRSLSSIVERGDLIRKIKIPRWVIILSSSLSAVINLIINLIVVVILMAINHVNVLATTLWLPLILVEVYVFALGLSLLLSAAFVKYRDVGYIWEIILQAAFYLTPIIYPISVISNITLQKLMFINPMTQTIQASRYAVVGHETITASKIFNGGPLMYAPILIVVFVFIVGFSYFKKQSRFFAENI